MTSCSGGMRRGTPIRRTSPTYAEFPPTSAGFSSGFATFRRPQRHILDTPSEARGRRQKFGFASLSLIVLNHTARSASRQRFSSSST